MFEYFIAKRYLRSKHRLNIISIISVISTIGVTIGVAALIIVLSVFNGFGSLVTDMLVKFDPHLRISFENEGKKEEIEKFLSNSSDVKSFTEYSEGKVILMKNKSMEILSLKGIPAKNKDYKERISTRLTFGDYSLIGDNNSENIIISLPIALRLSARIGDTLYATSANQIKNTITRMTLPKTQRFIVSGIYEISNKEYSLQYCFASINVAKSLFNRNNRIFGIEVILKDIDDSDMIKNELSANFNNLKINTWYDLHKDLYRVMLIERWAAYILLSLIIAVAAFNILTSLTMSVIEKKKDIGILRAMGTTSKSIGRIFKFEGILVGVFGTFLGIIIGLIVCYVQIEFNIYPLDASKYVIDTLPVVVKFSDVLAVSIMSMLLTFFSSRYPAKQALKTKILDAIKWE